MSPWASYITSLNFSFLNCKKRIFIGPLWKSHYRNWLDKAWWGGIVVDVACFVCPTLLLSSRVGIAFFYGTTLLTHFRIYTSSIVTPAYTSYFPIMFLHDFIDSVQLHGQFYFFVCWSVSKFLPTLQYLKSHFLSKTFPELPLSMCTLLAVCSNLFYCF